MRSGIANLLRVYHQASTDEHYAGQLWYQQAHDDAIALGHPEASAIIAALSPGLRWERNIEAARRVIAGEPLDGLGVRWYDGVRKAEKIRDGQNPSLVLRGNKVRAFWQCIANPRNATHVCVDGHAFSAWKYRRITLDAIPEISNAMYSRISSDYCDTAAMVSLTPCQLQAIVWVVWRRLHGVKLERGRQ